MRFARVIATVGLADLQSFQCDLCGVVLTGESVVEAQYSVGPLPTSALLENRQYPELVTGSNALGKRQQRP